MTVNVVFYFSDISGDSAVMWSVSDQNSCVMHEKHEWTITSDPKTHPWYHMQKWNPQFPSSVSP